MITNNNVRSDETTDDISDEIWDLLEKNVSRAAFDKLPHYIRNRIDHWVLENLAHYAPYETIEFRKGELRKWYMLWNYLFPGRAPPSPCELMTLIHQHNHLQALVYDESQEIFLSNTALLIRTFKEVVNASVQRGEIEGITDENLEKLQKCLEVAITRATRDSNDRPSILPLQTQDPLPEELPPSNMLDPVQDRTAWYGLDTQFQEDPFENIIGFMGTIEAETTSLSTSDKVAWDSCPRDAAFDSFASVGPVFRLEPFDDDDLE